MDFAFLFNNFVELTITGLALGAIYALIALGYTMVYGVLQLINFAHSEVFMYGTFAVAWVVVLLPRHRLGVARASAGTLGLLVLRCVAAMLTSAAIALLLERVAYRPLIKQGAPKLIILISAIGASFALAEIDGPARQVRRAGSASRTTSPTTSRQARNVYSSPVTIDPHGLFTIGGYSVTDVDLAGDRLPRW